jgi:hypothetical protein
MEEQTNSLKKTARIAGLWYLLLVIVGVYGLKYVQSQIVVEGNPAATTGNILTHEFIFRTGIFSNIIGNIIFLFLVLTLYRLLKTVNEHWAKLMVALVLVQIPVSFVIELFNYTSLMILKGDVMKSLSVMQKQEFGSLFLNMHNYGLAILEVFWGVWLIPLGLLVFRSEFIPRLIGVLLILGGAAYMADSFAFLLLPALDSFVSKFIIIASLGEIIIMLWLLIFGVKVQNTKQ